MTSAVYSILGKLMNTASEAVILQLMPILLYGLEACHLTKADICSLDFTVNRVFMKLFRTGNIEVVRDCQAFFNFDLPSVLLHNGLINLLVTIEILAMMCVNFCVLIS